jgi:hypothetical protein
MPAKDNASAENQSVARALKILNLLAGGPLPKLTPKT